ncbi:MAG: amino acid adenylation domain-containing protein, partial [Methylocystis sp.]|nr:amino acid adenylation domain-containing protein [Methylocystis sp.]
MAHRLRRLGAGPETLVGLCVDRSVELIVALLGVMKSGAAYLPLDPDQPRERLRNLINCASPVLLLTQERLLQKLPDDRPVLAMDHGGETFASEPDDNPDVEIFGDSLAYVIYTSGSTGQPNGVQITHANLHNCIAHFVERLPFGPNDNFLSVTTIAFDIAALELFSPLTVGARVHLADRSRLLDRDYLPNLIDTNRITVMQATPALWSSLFSLGWSGNAGLTALVGGEAVPQKLGEGLASACARAFNVYGPTETTIWSTSSAITRNSCEIGRPIANTEIYILDEALNPVPPGVVGHLHIAGAGLARGYLRRPELTAERFIPNPFSSSGKRLYRTGDLARYRSDGEIQFVGRTDHQVKIRGYRIELGDIEAALRRVDGVNEAAVVVRGDSGNEKQLIAYITLQSRQTSADVHTALASELPDYMIPHFIVMLDEMPHTPNGKIDRKSLPQPKLSDLTKAEFVEPATITERRIVDAFAAVLGLEKVGATDSFFRLGGDSIRAIQVASRLRQFGYDVTPRQLFENPTAATLGPILRSLDDANAEPGDVERALKEFAAPFALAELDATEIDRLQAEYGGIEDIYPLTPMQEGMYFHALSHKGSGLY